MAAMTFLCSSAKAHGDRRFEICGSPVLVGRSRSQCEAQAAAGGLAVEATSVRSAAEALWFSQPATDSLRGMDGTAMDRALIALDVHEDYLDGDLSGRGVPRPSDQRVVQQRVFGESDFGGFSQIDFRRVDRPEQRALRFSIDRSSSLNSAIDIVRSGREHSTPTDPHRHPRATARDEGTSPDSDQISREMHDVQFTWAPAAGYPADSQAHGCSGAGAPRRRDTGRGLPICELASGGQAYGCRGLVLVSAWLWLASLIAGRMIVAVRGALTVLEEVSSDHSAQPGPTDCEEG